MVSERERKQMCGVGCIFAVTCLLLPLDMSINGYSKYEYISSMDYDCICSNIITKVVGWEDRYWINMSVFINDTVYLYQYECEDMNMCKNIDYNKTYVCKLLPAVDNGFDVHYGENYGYKVYFKGTSIPWSLTGSYVVIEFTIIILLIFGTLLYVRSSPGECETDDAV